MLNADFYPTPAPIIRKMLAPYGDLHTRHILEPSAGKGDILDAITRAGARSTSGGRATRPRKRMVKNEKGGF